jgi:hypothetical protein
MPQLFQQRQLLMLKNFWLTALLDALQDLLVPTPYHGASPATRTTTPRTVVSSTN